MVSEASEISGRQNWANVANLAQFKQNQRKNHHFSTFVDFFIIFTESNPNWPHLANFASQKFLRPQRQRFENLYFSSKMYLNQVKELSRNFCRNSEIFENFKTLNTVLKHISVS